jgi:hypothetical protein
VKVWEYESTDGWTVEVHAVTEADPDCPAFCYMDAPHADTPIRLVSHYGQLAAVVDIPSDHVDAFTEAVRSAREQSAGKANP